MLCYEPTQVSHGLNRRKCYSVIAVMMKGRAPPAGASDYDPLKFLPADHFDWVVMDECTQAPESSFWIALLSSMQVHSGWGLQLLPTKKKNQRKKQVLLLLCSHR